MQTAVIIFFIAAFIYFLLREFKHNKAEESFLSIVNHTFRSPLTRIKWQSDNLKPDLSYEAQAEIARNISTTVNHVLEIIDTLSGIKDVHNSASYDLKAVSIREFIEIGMGKYRTTVTEKKLTFNLPAFNDMPLLTVDTKKISFVIEALLSNAIFYSHEGGAIDIRCIVKKGKLVLSIEDHGIGLSWRDKNNLYQRFYRGRRGLKMNTDGMGLSLYLSKEIIRRHHGIISFHSKGREHGSTFSITLPVRK
jgi:signal transduction histidine kinase